MNYKDLMHIVLIAISYYLFSNEFFKFTAEIKEEKSSYHSRILCFFLVYVWFIIASYLELPLNVNWFVFLILLGLEVHIVFSFDFVTSYALSIFCIIMGLSINVFFRSLVSILLNIPLNVFDNTMSYLKLYPILSGFIAMVFILRILRRNQFPKQLRRMLQYRKSLIFYVWTEIFICLFLMLQLLAYTHSDNEIGIKAWGIKAALFSIIVLIFTIIYSLRVASLHYYIQKRHEVRASLIQEKKDINKLWALAYTDMLTGCNNRQLLDKRLEEYAEYGDCITLAFIDANGLKIINDQYGHMEGDNYLISITSVLSEISNGLNIDLFRYGGDEFVIISNTLSEKEITGLLLQANERLKTESSMYSRSISYGVVHGDCADYQELIAAADNKMYKHKLKYYENTARA